MPHRLVFPVVLAAFGFGSNTDGAANHRIGPKMIEINTGGVVSFAVSGFHQITVYDPVKGVGDVLNPGSGTLIDDATDRIFLGLPPFDPGLNRTRVESVSFTEEGTYLVICNVRGHFFNDGMFAFVIVNDED